MGRRPYVEFRRRHGFWRTGGWISGAGLNAVNDGAADGEDSLGTDGAGPSPAPGDVTTQGGDLEEDDRSGFVQPLSSTGAYGNVGAVRSVTSISQVMSRFRISWRCHSPTGSPRWRRTPRKILAKQTGATTGIRERCLRPLLTNRIKTWLRMGTSKVRCGRTKPRV